MQMDTSSQSNFRSRVFLGKATLSVQEDIEFTSREMARLDDQIRVLSEERATLGCHLNSLQSSTGALPHEILSMIFQHTFNLIDPQKFAGHGWRQINILPLIRLEAVCSFWRQTLRSSPSLWTTFIAYVPIRTGKSTAAIIEHCLRNCGTRLLSLDLRFLPRELGSPHFDPSSLQPISDLIFKRIETAEKLGALQFEYPPGSWAPLLSNSNTLTNLGRFSLTGFITEVHTTFTLPSLPRLTRLTVTETFGDVIIPCARTITHLTMASTHLDICIRIFRQCVNLVECRFNTLNFRDRTEGPLRDYISSAITFPHLSSLSWVFADSYSNDALLRHINLPALRQLSFIFFFHRDSALIDPRQHLDTLRLFVSRLPSTLIKVEVERWKGHYSPIVHQLIGNLPSSIKELSLMNCSELFIHETLVKLTPEQRGTKYLPILEEFRVSARSTIYSSATVRRMVENRGDGVHTKFKLVLPLSARDEQGELEGLEQTHTHLKIEYRSNDLL